MGIKAAVKIRPDIAKKFLSPAYCPRANGKIILPAPKNIENIASPIAKDSDLNKLFKIKPL